MNSVLKETTFYMFNALLGDECNSNSKLFVSNKQTAGSSGIFIHIAQKHHQNQCTVNNNLILVTSSVATDRYIQH